MTETPTFLEPTDVSGALPPTQVPEEVREEMGANKDVPFLEAVDAAYTLETVAGTTLLNMQAQGFDYDPDYVMDEEQLAEWTEGINPEYHMEFSQALSKGHGDALRAQILEAQQHEETLSGMGWSGVGYRMLAAVTDPIAWGAMVASEGAAAPWIFASKASRLSQAVRGALVAGGGNAALETYLYSQSPTKTVDDILWAGAFGLGVGGALTPIVGSRIMRERQRETLREAADILHDNPTPKATEEPEVAVERAEEPPREEPTAEDLERHERIKELGEQRAQSKVAIDTAKAHDAEVANIMDEIGELTDMVNGKEDIIQWLHDVPMKGTEGNQKPDFSNPPVYMTDNYTDDEIKEIVAGLQERISTGSVASVRKAVRSEAKQLLKDKQKRVSRLEHLNSRTVTLRRLADEASVKAEAIEEELLDLQSVGAAKVRGIEEDLPLINEDTIDSVMEEIGTPARATGVLSMLRYDIIGRIMRGENPYNRTLASILAEDGMGRADHSVAGDTVSEATFRRLRKSLGNFHRASEFGYREWVKETGRSYWQALRPSVRNEFFTQVSDVVEGAKAAHPAIAKSATAMQEEFSNFLKELRDTGVKGFRDIPDNPNYFPRLVNKPRVHDIATLYKEGEVVKLIHKAIKKTLPDIDDVRPKRGNKTYTEILAAAYWKRMRAISRGLDIDLHIPLGDNLNAIETILKENDVDNETIEGVVYVLKQKGEKARTGGPARSKHRVDMDLNTSMKLELGDGSGVKELSMKDFFERDAEKVFTIYARQASGLIELGKKGIKSKADFDNWITAGRNYGGNVHQNNRHADALELIYDSIVGNPLEANPSSRTAAAARFLRDWNFLRIMGQVGFAQVAEFGNMLGQLGMRAVLTHLPEAGRAMRRMKETGEVDDLLASQLEAVTGNGLDRLVNQVSTRFDEHGFGVGNAGSFFSKVDNASQVAKRFLSDVSFMAPINIFLHRTALKSVVQNLTDAASGYSKISPKRLASLGMGEEMTERVFKLLRENTSRVDSTFGKGRKVNSLDVDAMKAADEEAFSHFVTALSRWANRIIQHNDVGATHELMHSTLGKIITQFRSFMLVAWTKQTLHNIHMADMQSVASFFHSMVFGGLAYAAQQTINSVGRDDQDEWLAERLDLAEWGKAAFQRSGHASLLPAAIDTVWTHLVSPDPVFAYGRSTSLASSAVMGNPSVDTVMKLSGVAGIAKNIRDDHELSQKNMRDAWGLLWLSNATGMRNFANILVQDLPSQSNTE